MPTPAMTSMVKVLRRTLGWLLRQMCHLCRSVLSRTSLHSPISFRGIFIVLQEISTLPPFHIANLSYDHIYTIPLPPSLTPSPQPHPPLHIHAHLPFTSSITHTLPPTLMSFPTQEKMLRIAGQNIPMIAADNSNKNVSFFLYLYIHDLIHIRLNVFISLYWFHL